MADQPSVSIKIGIGDFAAALDKIDQKLQQSSKELQTVAEANKILREQFKLTGTTVTTTAKDFNDLLGALNSVSDKQGKLVNTTKSINDALKNASGPKQFQIAIKQAVDKTDEQLDILDRRITASDIIRSTPKSVPPGEPGDRGGGSRFFDQFNATNIAASRSEIVKFERALGRALQSANTLLATTDGSKDKNLLFNERQVQEVFRAVRLKEQLDRSLFLGPQAQPGLKLVDPSTFPQLISVKDAVTKLFDAYEKLGSSVNRVKDAEIKSREAANAANAKRLAAAGGTPNDIKNTAEVQRVQAQNAARVQLTVEQNLATDRENARKGLLRKLGELEEQSNQSIARQARASVQREIAEVNRLRQQRIEDTQRVTSERFVGGIRATTGIPANADIGKVLQLNQALQNLELQARQAGIPLTTLQRIFASIKVNPGAFAFRELPSLPPVFHNVAQSMLEVDRAQQLIERSGKAASDSMILSWRGIARIFEAQVIHRALSTIYNDLLANIGVAAELQVRISEIRTVTQSAQIPFAEIQGSLRALSDEFGNQQVDVARAAYEALSNQVVKGTQTFQFLRQALILSQTTVTDAKTAVNLLSSAINAFKLQAEDAERINSVFFKTIELGRLRAEEISDTFGRSGVLAQKLGISIEEVGAALATMTIQGFRVDESQTLLTNLMLKLLKPTEAFTALLEEMGFKSGPAAVAALGLGGILEKLSEQGEKGAEVLALQINELRALKGAFTLTGDSLSTYQKNLQQIGSADAVAQTAEAARLIRESSGKEFLVFQEQIKNVFIDAGNTIIAKFIEIKKAIEGIGNFISPITNLFDKFVGFGNVLKVVTISFLAYKTALAASTIVVGIHTARQEANAIASARAAAGYGIQTNALQRLTAAMTASNVASAAGIALFTAVTFDAQRTIDSIENLNTGGAALAVRLDKETQATKVATFKVNDEIKQSYIKRNEEIFRDALQLSAKLLANTNKESKGLVDASKSVTDALKLGFDGYVKGLNEAVKKTKSTIDQNKKQIEDSAKFLQNLVVSNPEKLFQRSLKFEEDPQNQLNLIQRRIGDLKREVSDLFGKGDEESVKAAQAKVLEIEKLIEQQLDIRVAQRKEHAQQLAREGLLVGQVNDKGQILVNTADLLNKAEREQIANRETLKKLQDENARQKTEESQKTDIIVKKEESRIAAITAAAKELEGFKVLNDKGEVAKKFATPQGELDVEKVQKEAKRLSESLNVLFGADKKEQVSLIQLFNAKLRVEEASAQAQRNEQATKAEQQRLQDLKKHYEDVGKASSDHVNELNKQLADSLDIAAKLSGAFQRISQVGTRRGFFQETIGVDILPGLAGISDGLNRIESIPTSTKITELNEQVQQTISRIKELQKQGKLSEDDPLFKKLEIDAKNLAGQLEQNIRIRNQGFVKGGGKNTIVDVDGEKKNIGEMQELLRRLVEDIPKIRKEIEAKSQVRDRVKEDQENTARLLKENLEVLETGSTRAASALTEVTTKLSAFGIAAGALAGGPLAVTGAAGLADTTLSKQLTTIGDGARGVLIDLQALHNTPLEVEKNKNNLDNTIIRLKELNTALGETIKLKEGIQKDFPPGLTVPRTEPTPLTPPKGNTFTPKTQQIQPELNPDIKKDQVGINNTTVGDIVFNVASAQGLDEQKLSEMIKRGIRRGTITF